MGLESGQAAGSIINEHYLRGRTGSFAVQTEWFAERTG